MSRWWAGVSDVGRRKPELFFFPTPVLWVPTSESRLNPDDRLYTKDQIIEQVEDAIFAGREPKDRVA